MAGSMTSGGNNLNRTYMNVHVYFLVSFHLHRIYFNDTQVPYHTMAGVEVHKRCC